MSCCRVKQYLNFLICFPVKKLHCFGIVLSLGVDLFYSLYYLIVYFADPLFIVSSKKDHTQANMQAFLSRSRLVGLIHSLRQPNKPEALSVANGTDKIDSSTNLHWTLYSTETILPLLLGDKGILILVAQCDDS